MAESTAGGAASGGSAAGGGGGGSGAGAASGDGGGSTSTAAGAGSAPETGGGESGTGSAAGEVSSSATSGGATATSGGGTGTFRGPPANTTGGGFTGLGSSVSRTEAPLGITGARLDPLIAYQFSITFGTGAGQFVAYAVDVSGLDFERDYIEHKFVNQQYQAVTQMIPGRIKWGPITLKRLLTTDTAMWDWFMDHEGPSLNTGSYSPKKYAAARLPVTITAWTRDFTTEAIRWELTNAWPSKIAGPQFDSKSGDFAFEEVTLVFESITRTVAAGSGSVEATSFSTAEGG